MREKTNLTLHSAVKEAALALAASQGRSLSELVERLLEREVEKRNSPSTRWSMKEESVDAAEVHQDADRVKVTYRAKPRSKKKSPAGS
jgi:hypothetical protein